MLKTCTDCSEEKDLDEFYKHPNTADGHCSSCGSCRREYQRERQREIRRFVIQGYGGICVCCEESRFEFLSIDHVHGGGRKDTAEKGGNCRLYFWLVKEGFPTDNYRILCHNCNMAKGSYGYCPHEVE